MLHCKMELFPDELKIARVAPLFKNGSYSPIYRPVSVFPCFSKILEKIMDNQLIIIFFI